MGEEAYPELGNTLSISRFLSYHNNMLQLEKYREELDNTPTGDFLRRVHIQEKIFASEKLIELHRPYIVVKKFLDILEKYEVSHLP